MPARSTGSVCSTQSTLSPIAIVSVLEKPARRQIDRDRIERVRVQSIDGGVFDPQCPRGGRDEKIAKALVILFKPMVADGRAGFGLDGGDAAPTSAGDNERNAPVFPPECDPAGESLIVVRMRRKDGVGHDLGLMAASIDVVEHVRAANMSAAAVRRMVNSEKQRFPLACFPLGSDVFEGVSQKVLLRCADRRSLPGSSSFDHAGVFQTV